ncbi:hypothetical protein [Collibacillus ludicampi]|jgi:hypothetical protein|nr:hypothetical protein [Collibacillus ludicampi]
MRRKSKIKRILYACMIAVLLTSSGFGLYFWQSYQKTKYHVVSNATEL